MVVEAQTPVTWITPADSVKPAENMDEGTKEVVTDVAPEFNINAEFKNLIPPLDPDVREDLKENLRKEGCRDPLVICKLDGEYVLLDGHNRYEICEELQIPYTTTEISVSNRTEAKIWIIKNQRARRNLSESQRAMLAVRLETLYAEAAKDRRGIRTDLGQNFDRGDLGRSAEKAARDMGVSHQTVSSAKKVSEKGIPALAELVESGKVAVSAAATAASHPREVQQVVVEKVKEKAKEGKRVNIAKLLHEVAPKTPEKDAQERFKKSKKGIDASLKLLQGIDAVQSPEELAEMRELVEKLMVRLKEISDKSLHLSKDLRNRIDEAPSEMNADGSPIAGNEDAPPSDDEGASLSDDEEEQLDGSADPKDSQEGELPEDWDSYREAIDSEDDENQ